MKQIILLCFLMTLWEQAFSQKNNLQKHHEIHSSEFIKPLIQASLSQKNNIAISAFQEPNPEKAENGTVRNSAEFPEFWPDRLFIKLRSGDKFKLPTFKNKASKNKVSLLEIPANEKFNKAVKRHPIKKLTELPSLKMSFAEQEIYEVILENATQTQLLMQELRALPEVEYVERVPYYVPLQTPNDPYYINKEQYALQITKAAEAFAIHTGTSRTLLAIVDDAVLITHPDLESNINTLKSYDVADNDSDPRPPSSGPNKAKSHGTICAGIAGAVTGNGAGTAAISNNKISIIGVKCTRDDAPPNGGNEFSYTGIVHAINQGAQVISMSFGSTGGSVTLQHLINEATANGVIFVAAAGNDNNETKFYPAAYDNVIAVASTDVNDHKSSFSNYGTWVDISAPGTNILSTVPAADGISGDYNYATGTSMACPMVAGLVALMLSQNPNLTPQAVTQILKDSADPLENIPNQRPDLAGKLGGRINAYRAILAVKSSLNASTPTAVSDLQVIGAGPTELEIEWTAPEVAGAAASTYEIRYATAPLTAANYESAQVTKVRIIPGEPGFKQKLVINELAPGTTYYIAMVAKSFYGAASPLSNVARGTTLAAPVIQVNPNSYTINLDRTISHTNSLNFNLANVGPAPLSYKTEVVPIAGSNVLSYDKPQQKPDLLAGGLGNGTIISATKFTAGASGFSLTHVQNYLYRQLKTDKVEVGIRILKGGTHPGNATLISSETTTLSIPAGGKFFSLPLQVPQQFAPGEVFWIAFVLPWQNVSLGYTLQGFDRINASPDLFFLSTDNGNTYEDAQNIFPQAVFKMRASNANWISLNPGSGNIQPGGSSNISVDVNTIDLSDGLYQVDASFISNDPLTPVINRPVTITVTGGRPKFVSESVKKDFGTLFLGNSGTIKVIIANAGSDTLMVNSELKNSEPFAPTDFTLNIQGAHSLPPGKQQEVMVTFTPSKNGLLDGTLTLSSNDPEANPTTVALSANVILPPVALITPASLEFDMDYGGVTTATAEVQIQNIGEGELTKTLQILAEPLATISYDANRQPESYLRASAHFPAFQTALKFDVTTTAFNLTHVQNFIRTGVVLNKNVTIKVFKGGTTPIAGTLVMEQTSEIPAVAANGALITFPLQQPYPFKQGDVFWIVFYFNGINQPQGINTNNPNPGRNFFSYDEKTWFSLESRTGLYVTSTFIIKALEMPQWLSVTASAANVAAGNLQNNTVTVNTTGLQKGKYKGRVEVMTNDPKQPLTTIEVNLHLEESPLADFKANNTVILPGEEVTFQNLSKNADAYEWQLAGAESIASSLISPAVVYTTPGKYKVSLKAKNTGNGRVSQALVKEDYITVQDIVCQDLNSPFTGNAALATNQDGYLTGNNTKGDIAKANFFEYSRPDAFVTGIKIKFGAAVAASTNAIIKIAVWDTNSSYGKPQSIIAIKDVSLKEVAADVKANRITEVILDAPVRITGSFYAGVILNNEVGNTVAIGHNANQDRKPGVAWTQDSQHNWMPFRSVWPELNDIALYIQPTITQTRNPISAAFTINAESFCAGEPVKLDASATKGAVRYEWLLAGAATSSTTEVNPIVIYTAAGSYKIILKAYDACSGVSVFSKDVVIQPVPDAVISITGSTSLCAGEKVTLSAVAGDGLTYQWSNGATTRYITVSESGKYSVHVKNTNGCVVASEEVKTIVNPLIAKPIIKRNDVILTSNAIAGNRWFRNNTSLPLATSVFYDVTEPGIYQVRITNANGCISEMSEGVTITETDLITGLKLYPNPGNGNLNIAFTGLKPDKVNVHIINALGQVIYKKDVQGSREFKIDISTAAAGVYMLHLQHNGSVFKRRIVVQH